MTRKKSGESSPYLIYGLIDPRTRLIRYIGLSSSGLRRPKQHRHSCHNSYCRNWIKALQSLGLDYEITVLETVKSETKLGKAESWWIAYGKACDWPLTNIMPGGYLSKEAVLERKQRLKRVQQEATEARRLPLSSPEEIEAFNRSLRERHGIPAAIKKRCFQFFETHAALGDDLIAAVISEVRVTRATAIQLYAKWRPKEPPEDKEARCFRLFEKYIGSDDLIVDVVIEGRIHPDEAERLYKKWLRFSMQRGKKALMEERNRLRNESKT